MANEIQLSAAVSVSKNGAAVSASGAAQATQSGNATIENIQNIGITQETLLLGDVGTPQYLFIKNLDATNFVQIDADSTFDKFPQKIVAGGFIILAPETATIYAKADTAAVNVLVLGMSA
jgi:hypothetical protein